MKIKKQNPKHNHLSPFLLLTQERVSLFPIFFLFFYFYKPNHKCMDLTQEPTHLSLGIREFPVCPIPLRFLLLLLFRLQVWSFIRVVETLGLGSWGALMAKNKIRNEKLKLVFVDVGFSFLFFLFFLCIVWVS